MIASKDQLVKVAAKDHWSWLRLRIIDQLVIVAATDQLVMVAITDQLPYRTYLIMAAATY